MATPLKVSPSVLNRNYQVHYKNTYDQVDVLEGELLSTDTNGLFVFVVGTDIVMIPKEKILLIRGAI